MRKLIYLLIVCGLAIAFYHYVYQPYLSPVVDFYRQSGEVLALNDRIENQEVFTPPSDAALSAEQVERYVEVQHAIVEAMGSRVDSLRLEFERLRDDVQLLEGRVELAGLADSMRDVLDAVIEAKEAQVEALNRHGFSLGEYKWVRREVYRAAGVPLPGQDLADIVADVRRGRFDLEAIVSEERPDSNHIPEGNRDLVHAHVETLREHAGLALLGL